MNHEQNTYKILFVDDEQLIRNGLVHTVDWAAYNFEITGTASNGKKALLLCRQQRPDIVITDIKMPVMDGLDLTKQLLALYPGIRVILLSAHNEFTYAQQALSLGACEYILKSELDCDTLLAVVLKVAAQIEEQRQQVEQTDSIRQQMDRYSIRLQENLLWRMLTESCYSQEVARQLQDYHVPLRAKELLLLHICLKDSVGADVNFADFAADILDPVYALVSSPSHGILIGNWHRSTPLESVVAEVNKRCSAATGGEAFVYCSPAFGGYEQIHRQNHALLSHLHFHTFYDCLRSMVCSGPRPPKKGLDSSVVCMELTRALDRHLHTELDAQLEALLAELPAEQYEPEDVKETVYMVCSLLAQAANDTDGNHRELEMQLEAFTGGGSIKDRVFGFRTFSELYAEASGFLRATARFILRHMISYGKIVSQAIVYIDQHLDEELTLQVIAGNIFCNPAYLSQCFKKELGMKFTEYLLNKRIAIAKLLLTTTNLSVYQVAEQVGIHNPSYFSKVFLKLTGQQPISFRLSEREEQLGDPSRKC